MKPSKEAAAKRNLAMLKKAGITFGTKDGVSYFTTNTPDSWDFWPTTGAWFNKTTKTRGGDFKEAVSKMGDCSPIQHGHLPNPRSNPSIKQPDAPRAGEVYQLKVNLNINGNYTCVSSKRFTVTDASVVDVREKALADVTIAIDRELQRAKGRSACAI